MGQLMLVNPRKRRAKRRASTAKKHRRVARKSHARRRRNPIAAAPRRHVRRRRNPLSSGAKLNLGNSIKLALTGAAGGLVLDLAYGYIGNKLPSTWQTGALRHVAKFGIALGLGILASKSRMMKGHMAVKMTEGALITTMHGALRGSLATAWPSARLGEYVPLAEYIPLGGDGSGGGDDPLMLSGTAENALSATGFYVEDEYAMDGVYPTPYSV